jgi:hypothetical protein
LLIFNKKGQPEEASASESACEISTKVKLDRYPERFAQEALGHNSKAVHRAYARQAQVRLPSLESYEKQNLEGRIIPLPPLMRKSEGNGHTVSAAG